MTRCTRKPGTGCISDLNDHLFGGRYLPAWPDGTKHFKPAYVHTREELKVLILQMNAGRKAVQDRLRGIPPPCELHKKERQIWAYMKFHPEEIIKQRGVCWLKHQPFSIVVSLRFVINSLNFL